jgi:hypothetical protein
MIQIHYQGEIDLFAADDAAGIGTHVMGLLKDADAAPEPRAAAVDPEVLRTDADAYEAAVEPDEPPVVEAEPVTEREAQLAQDETERHVRQAIDGLIPGGSRIIDILQTISNPE